MTAQPDGAAADQIRRIYLDQTHLRGHVTGIERVTLDLFAPDTLAPHEVRAITSRSLPGMITAQHLAMPLHALRDRDALFLFPGFPPARSAPWRPNAACSTCTTPSYSPGRRI